MYRLSNISLTDFNIQAGRASNSTLALEGMFDMPKRTGKTYHSWEDHNGVEPYVSASEIFFDGRDIKFTGLFRAIDRADAVYRLNDFYDFIASFTGLVDFETPYGTFEVYVKEEIKIEYLDDGWAKIVIIFREPVVTIPNPTIPGEIDYQVYGIDGLPFSEAGMFVQSVSSNMNRSDAKKQNYTAYGYEGFQITKTDALKAKISLLVHRSSVATLKTSIEILHKQLASEGIKSLNIDGARRESFAVDGFSVKNIKSSTGLAVAIIDVELILTKLLAEGNNNTFTFSFPIPFKP